MTGEADALALGKDGVLLTGPAIAYFVSRFPHLYQTFVRREIDELVRQGARITVFPVAGMRPGGRRDAVHAPSRQPVEIVHASLRRPCTWRRVLAEFRRSPGPCALLAWRTVLAARGRPAPLLKSLVALVKGMAWSAAIRSGGFAHIHAHWSTYPAAAALAASELTGTPFSFAFHAYDVFATRLMIPEKIERAAFVVANCRYTRDHVLREYPGTDPDKLVLLYNGLDLPKYMGLPRTPDLSCPLILAIGQLVPTKGFIDLVAACGRLAAGGTDFRLVIAGSGRLRRELAAAARAHGIAARVECPGERTEEQIRALLSRATLLVMPCVTPRRGTHDALPNAIIEALAAGVPVVATDVFGIPEVVEHEATGILVPERSPAALHEAILRVIADPAPAGRWAVAGQRRAAELFDGEKNGADLLQRFKRNPA